MWACEFIQRAAFKVLQESKEFKIMNKKHIPNASSFVCLLLSQTTPKSLVMENNWRRFHACVRFLS